VTTPLSILDLAPVRPGESPATAFSASVELARRAEELGYRRIWYAEHHNMATIASSATSVLIAHVAAHTTSIRLGAGGVMLPNHAPLTIAEQFGTLESLHPGRIDLGLGRAPGTDEVTLRALRRSPASADRFPEDVLELQGYLTGRSLLPGVDAMPGKGTNVPLYILGSSTFGAQLAAALGLPYAFASHFAPGDLDEAVAAYRSRFRPSAQLDHPYVIAGVNVVVAEDGEDAARQFLAAKRNRVRSLLARHRIAERDGRDPPRSEHRGDGHPGDEHRGDESMSDDEADRLLSSPAARHVEQMATYSAVGTPPEAAAYLRDFAAHAQADELMVVHQSPTAAERLRSVELLAEQAELAAAG